jgi:hypothetical protein
MYTYTGLVDVAVAPEAFVLPHSRSVDCFGYLLLGCTVISVSFIICVLTLLLMPLARLHFCVGLDFVTPLVVIFFK